MGLNTFQMDSKGITGGGKIENLWDVSQRIKHVYALKS